MNAIGIKKCLAIEIAGWFSMSPLSRLHHHDITTIVELFSCNLERCSHTENMDLALGQVSLLTKTFWRRDFPWVLQFSVYSRVATPIQVETIVMHYKIWTSSWNHGGGQYEVEACSILTWHDLKHYSSTHRNPSKWILIWGFQRRNLTRNTMCSLPYIMTYITGIWYCITILIASMQT